MINGLHACNEMRLLQDPVWAGRSDSISPNVQPKPVWHPDRGIPFVVFTALRPITKGEELLISYGEVRITRSFASFFLLPNAPLKVACLRLSYGAFRALGNLSPEFNSTNSLRLPMSGTPGMRIFFASSHLIPA